MSLQDADALTPQIHLANIIGELEPSDVETVRIIVASPDYMKNLTKILSGTSKEGLQTFFCWKVIQAFASVTETDALVPYTRFINELQGKVMLPEWLGLSDANTFRILTPPKTDGELVSITSTMVSAGF